MSDVDPTGAARTAEPELDETERTLEQRGERDMLDLIRRVRRLQHAATLSHLAGQAGPEVRGLLPAKPSCVTTRWGEDGTQRTTEYIHISLDDRTALLAAYAALRQQRDEAVAAKEVAESIRDVGYKIRRYVSFVLTGDEEADVQVAAERAKDRIAALEAEAASERQRAERAEAEREEMARRVLRFAYWNRPHRKVESDGAVATETENSYCDRLLHRAMAPDESYPAFGETAR